MKKLFLYILYVLVVFSIMNFFGFVPKPESAFIFTLLGIVALIFAVFIIFILGVRDNAKKQYDRISDELKEKKEKGTADKSDYVLAVVKFIILAVLPIVAFILIPFITKETLGIEYSEISSELGSINIDSLLDDPVDDYEGDADYDLEIKDYYVGFTNLDTVYDLLPLEAISNLPDDVAVFLNTHGYGDVHTLTVKEDSIVYDQAYPYFICTMEDIDNSFVEIRYDISKSEFEFSIVNVD